MSAARAPAAIIFDMDGVLVDATPSYRAVTVETVRRMVSERAGFVPAIDPTWPEALKTASGFNNDWDLSWALVSGILAEGRGFEIAAYQRALRDAGGGILAVGRVLGAQAGLADYEAVKATFQALYLGPARYIDREVAIASLDGLRALRLPLGVATGRPRDEARYALARFGMGALFLAVVTHDCVVDAKQRHKPDPWCLQEAARRLGVSGPCVYVGDTPDDIRAAHAAGFVAVGVTADDPRRAAALQAMDPEWLIAHPDELATLAF